MTAAARPLAPAAPTTPESEETQELFVARQPIFDLEDRLAGYELLYRQDGLASTAEGTDAESMSRTVLVNAFLGVGIRDITDGERGWVNFTRDQIVSDLWRLVDPDLVVVEVLEDVGRDPEVIAACRRMREEGYVFALDDFVFGETEGDHELLALGPVVKVDVLGRTVEDLQRVVARLATYGVALLAERVETQAVRDACRRLGFSMFQGFFFSRPETVVKREPAVQHLTIIRLLNLLNDPRVTDKQIDQVISGDLPLAYKLLRMVNSAAMGGRGIDSISQAVRLLGRQPLHRWVSLLLVSTLVAEGGSRAELAYTAMRRARYCEQLMATSTGAREHGAAFMVGLFSLIDAVLRMPMDLCLENIDLSPEVQAALLYRSGPLVAPLMLVEAYEMAMWDTVHDTARALDVPAAHLPRLYMDAVRWTKERLG